jgi:dTDP-glucose 4,6-dehydratase
MRILVTGGCGFIGANFVLYMLEKYPDVEIVNLDKVTYAGNPANLKSVENDKRYAFVKGDICDRAVVERLVPAADAVINFAAESHVDRSIKYPDEFVMTNVHGVNVLLEAARKHKIKKFIQIGTDEVYGSIAEGLSKETDRLDPRSPYSSTKAAGDLLALSYFTTYGLPVIVTRSSNNFGPYQYPEKMIPLFITNLIKGEKVPLYGDGGNMRDWLYVRDNCAGIDAVLRKGKSGEIYNIGGGNVITNLDITKRILSLMAKDESSIKHVSDRPGHDRRYALDSSKTKELGWTPSLDFNGLLKQTVDWYVKNEPWWKPLTEKAEIIKW